MRANFEGFGLQPRLFLPFGQKKVLSMRFLPILGNFLCSVLTDITFSSTLNKFEKTPKIHKDLKKSKNISRFTEILKKY